MLSRLYIHFICFITAWIVREQTKQKCHRISYDAGDTNICILFSCITQASGGQVDTVAWRDWGPVDLVDIKLSREPWTVIAVYIVYLFVVYLVYTNNAIHFIAIPWPRALRSTAKLMTYCIMWTWYTEDMVRCPLPSPPPPAGYGLPVHTQRRWTRGPGGVFVV